jgi:hypothetical protein
LSVLRGPVGGWHGTGQREVRISRRLLTIPLENDGERTHLSAWCGADEWKLSIDLDELERKAIACRKKAGDRRKRNCRHKIKHGRFRHMLTGTYRENMLDFDRMHKDFAAWMRKVKAIIPKFRSVWAFEPQKRGAWHFHATCDSLPRHLRHKGELKPAYAVLTLLWQEVIGEYQFQFCGPLQPGETWPVLMLSGGTINVDGYTKKTFKKQHADAKNFSLAKMAGYVSKYLNKHERDGLAGRQLWGSSQDLTPPKAIRLEFPEGSLPDLISACFEVPPGHRVARHWLNQWGDCWVLDTEPISS